MSQQVGRCCKCSFTPEKQWITDPSTSDEAAHKYLSEGERKWLLCDPAGEACQRCLWPDTHVQYESLWRRVFRFWCKFVEIVEIQVCCHLWSASYSEDKCLHVRSVLQSRSCFMDFLGKKNIFLVIFNELATSMTCFSKFRRRMP